MIQSTPETEFLNTQWQVPSPARQLELIASLKVFWVGNLCTPLNSIETKESLGNRCCYWFDGLEEAVTFYLKDIGIDRVPTALRESISSDKTLDGMSYHYFDVLDLKPQSLS